MAAVSFRGVSVEFQEEDIGLEDVSIDIERGEFVFLTGRNGAGKSTFLRLLNRQLKPTRGEVLINGRSLGNMEEGELSEIRRRIGFMQREYGLLNDRTLYENVALALRATGRYGWRSRARVNKMLDITGIRHRADSYPEEVSVGEAARVLLARAMMPNPEILIADEPTANLDPDASWDFMLLLDEVNRLGVTVIVACHDQELVSVMRKRVVTLSAGRLVADERNAVYNVRAADAIEERRIIHARKRESA